MPELLSAARGAGLVDTRVDPDGVYHPTWTPGGRSDKPDVPGKKAEARRLTRVRRMRYFPVRVAGGRILVALPAIDAV